MTRNAAAKKQKIHSWLPVESRFCRRSAIEKPSSPVSSATRIAVAIAADQHQQRADEGRRSSWSSPRSATAAEDADQEEERDQHQVEEEDEEQQVLGEEGAQGRGLAEPEQK